MVVADPFRSRKIVEELSVQKGYGRAKNDQIDSEMLAEQTRIGLAPGIHVPTSEQLEIRTACRHRFELVRRRTVASNLIHSTLSMHGHAISIEELINNQNSKKRLFEQLPEYLRLIIEDFIAQIERFTSL